MTEKSGEKSWIQIAGISELEDIGIGSAVGIEVEKENGSLKALVLTRASREQWYALDNLCTHDGGPLQDGYIDLEDCSIECERHGAKFNMKSGEVLSMPAIHAIETYPVKIENGVLFIQL